MTVDSSFYIHPSDKAALDALKAIPGFTPLLKAFMQVWNEQKLRVCNMATNLRVDKNQLSKYYYMLPPICEKLGIDIPELYLTLDVIPNAFTYGDTKPFIVMTSGLLETLPEDLIPTVLAHECGHIACHHVLYRTMGTMILNGSLSLLGSDIANLVITPIQIAFSYWMRCSEYSADRAAVLCDGTADKMVETCMRFAGFDKDIHEETNVQAFMSQAEEYKELISDSKWNQALEFILFKNNDHPLNSIRAYECNEWQHSTEYSKIQSYLNFSADYELPVAMSAKKIIGQNYNFITNKLRNLGFSDIQVHRDMQKRAFASKEQILDISIDGKKDFTSCSWFKPDCPVIITYYEPETDVEIVAAHPNQATTPESSQHYHGKPFQQAVLDFQNAGFFNISIQAEQITKKGWLAKDGLISSISIGNIEKFEKGIWLSKDSLITITYQVFTNQKRASK